MSRWNAPNPVLLLGVLLCAPLNAQVTQRVSLSSSGAQGNLQSFMTHALTPDGRYVAFTSLANNLVPADTNGAYDVFLRDRHLGTTELVSVDSKGTQGNLRSDETWISADGRFVSFRSMATNLVPGDTNDVIDLFLRDRVAGTTERISVATNGQQANDHSFGGPITPDGRFVVYSSYATNLVPNDTNGERDIFLHDRRTGLTERVNLGPGGGQANRESQNPTISDDGRYVAFDSWAWNLVAGDTNGQRDQFVRDRQAGVTERASVSSNGTQGISGYDDYGLYGRISADGRFVAFTSGSYNLVPGDSNGEKDVFVHDRVGGATELMSVGTDGTQGNNDSGQPFVSADGRYVAFHSFASNLVPGARDGVCYLRDRVAGTLELVSVSSSGIAGDAWSITGATAVTPDGRFAAFDGWSSNLVPGDTNGYADIFVRDRYGGTEFTSLCQPGADGVRNCPCANPPIGPVRGCDNSSATGGAALTASGGSFLSSDSLVFETSGEKPSVLSILMQGNGAIPSGVIHGQGVRCLGGTIIRRLFVAQASGGSIRVPDFGLGQSTVSARSAAKGDVIQAAESRYYLVYYRDPVVLGGCPPTRTFNATQTGLVRWSP